MTERKIPSLDEPESTGGETGGRGYHFQYEYLASQIPYWLSHEGFTSLLSEGIGDIEIKMFSPSHGYTRELIQVKDAHLTPANFWNVIDRFHSVNLGSPETYSWFRVVVQGVSDRLSPLTNTLRRLRSPYGFYDETSNVIQNTLDNFSELVREAGKPEEYSDFIYRHVLIDTRLNPGLPLFRENVSQHLPIYADLPYQTVETIYHRFLRMASIPNTQITRKEIELVFSNNLPPDFSTFVQPINIRTLTDEDNSQRNELDKDIVLNWSDFSGGSERTFPEENRWNDVLVSQLEAIKQFVNAHRSSHLLCLHGSQRLSAAIAIGKVFSATSSLSIIINHRGRSWRTDEHGTTDDEDIISKEYVHHVSRDLVVAFSIDQSIRPTVENYFYSLGETSFALLNLTGHGPVESAGAANSIIRVAKNEINHALMESGATRIHLFCKIPRFLAVFLGHRLNATARTIQCYEYIGPNQYVPTCALHG